MDTNDILTRIEASLGYAFTDRALLVRADEEEYAIPLQSIVETLELRPGEGHEINHSGILRWRRRMVPLLDLGCIFGTSAVPRSAGYAVVLEADRKHRGLVADAITGSREILVKELDPIVGKPQGISGGTILGDGRVILILEPRGLVAIDPVREPGPITQEARR